MDSLQLQEKPSHPMSSKDPVTMNSDHAEHAEANPKLRQQFSKWSLGSLCLCLMATWEALASVVTTALNAGASYHFWQPSQLRLRLLRLHRFTRQQEACQYHWVALLAPPKLSRWASWFTGWISCGGQIVLTVSAAFSAGLQLQALVTVNNPDTYTPERWQGMLFYWLILAYALVINLWGSRLLAKTNIVAGVIHIAAFVAMMAVLLAMAPKQTAHFVFVETTNSSGWSNDGISWLVGMLSAVYPFLGYDSAVHIAEEMSYPSRDVPIAMVGSVLINGIMGLGFCITLLFSIGNLESILTTPTGFPFIQLLSNVTMSRAGTTILCLAWTSIAIAATSAGITSTSRTAWAFARDNALPFSGYFTHIDEKLKVPKRMIICIIIAQMLLGLLYLGSSTAFTAVLSMAVLGMYASYILPIICMLLYGRKDDSHKPGPFQLGKMGAAINVISIAWLMLIMVFSTFPNFQPVTAENMNYCIVVMGGWLFFGVIYYYIQGRKNYKGPVIEVLEMVI
ncbi:hypothetical protein VTL71DRAFT_16523 [Oculimacula yallundae]|uniref:Amino acid transporter n=1 Tax=Oculimacula yallundae TaxID=86028 RepID=A0ABR4CFA6_9HELO